MVGLTGRGSGHGDGSGRGSGDGRGYGDGSGDGYGSGSGDGYGDTIGAIGEHAVRLLKPWRFVVVGCQCHAIDWWRVNWRELAKQERVSVFQSQVEELLCRVTSSAAEPMDVQ